MISIAEEGENENPMNHCEQAIMEHKEEDACKSRWAAAQRGNRHEFDQVEHSDGHILCPECQHDLKNRPMPQDNSGQGHHVGQKEGHNRWRDTR